EMRFSSASTFKVGQSTLSRKAEVSTDLGRAAVAALLLIESGGPVDNYINRRGRGIGRHGYQKPFAIARRYIGPTTHVKERMRHSELESGAGTNIGRIKLSVFTHEEQLLSITTPHRLGTASIRDLPLRT